MMNPRYLQRFGDPQPFRDSIARAALRYDPEAPYGNPELEGTEGQRQFEQPDVEPSMNKDSMVAAEDPYANYGSENGNDAGARQIMQPQAESSTKLNPLESVNDPYLDYDSEVPIRATRRLFQPPPLPSMKRGSMVGIEDEPPMAPSAPLVIDTRELPTEAPPENPIRRYQRELDELKAPERGPVSKWAKLAAVALGAGQGYYNAANPNARPIDASEAVQNLTLGRKYLDAMGEYQRKRKDIGERMKLAGDAEQVETNRTYRESLAANSRRADEDRDEAQRLKNFQFSINMARDGGKTLPANSPLTPGAIRMPNPLDKTGNTVVDIVPKNESRKITDQDIADALGMDVGDSVSDTMYQEGFKKVMEYRQALKLKQIEVDNKNPPVLQPGAVLLQEAQKPGSFPQAVVAEAKRQFSEMHRTPAASQSFGDGDYSPKQLQALTRLNESVSKNANFVRTNSMKNYAATVLSGLSQKTGVGDIAAINQFQKLIDEGAVTRDQDVRLIQGSQDLMNKLKAQISNLTSGQQLSPDLRQQMIAASNAMYETQRKAQANDPYFVSKVKEAKRYGLNIEDTILDGMGDQSAPAQNAGPGRSGGGLPKVTTPAEYAAVRSGQKFQDENGNVRTKK